MTVLLKNYKSEWLSDIFKNCFRIQEEDGGFFEKLGSRLVEKVQIQELEESLESPSTTGEFSEEVVCKAKILGALSLEKENRINRAAETTSESSETEDDAELIEDLLAESVGLNVSIDRLVLLGVTGFTNKPFYYLQGTLTLEFVNNDQIEDFTGVGFAIGARFYSREA